jgi:hypothetical protein
VERDICIQHLDASHDHQHSRISFIRTILCLIALMGGQNPTESEFSLSFNRLEQTAKKSRSLNLSWSHSHVIRRRRSSGIWIGTTHAIIGHTHPCHQACRCW